MIKSLARWPDYSGAWKLLFLSALGLELAALYFQYVMDLQPCIMCVYQRAAVFGILISALVGIFLCHIGLFRFLALVGWGVGAVWGGIISYQHVEIQSSSNAFFATCEIVPNFPKWLPLHEWLPSVFAATGDCGDINWHFMQMTMPQWMLTIFAFYTMLLAVVVLSRIITMRRL